MPIYEYKCDDCGAINEFIVFSANEGVACRSCNSPKMTKLMSAHNTSSPSGSSAMPGFGGGCCGSAGGSCGMPGSCCGQ
ncbi:MAG: FmdB family zinc ribbon protein [Syntrophorhabdaceae bacterium]